MIELTNDSGYVNISELLLGIKDKINKENLYPYLEKVSMSTNTLLSGLKNNIKNGRSKYDSIEEAYQDLITESGIDIKLDKNRLASLDIKYYYNIYTDEFSSDPVFGQTYLVYDAKLKKVAEKFKDEILGSKKITPDDVWDKMISKNKDIKINRYLKNILSGKVINLTEINRFEVPFIHLDVELFEKSLKKSSYQTRDVFLDLIVENANLETTMYIVKSDAVLFYDVIISEVISKYIDNEYIYSKYSNYVVLNFNNFIHRYKLLELLQDQDFVAAINNLELLSKNPYNFKYSNIDLQNRLMNNNFLTQFDVDFTVQTYGNGNIHWNMGLNSYDRMNFSNIISIKQVDKDYFFGDFLIKFFGDLIEMIVCGKINIDKLNILINKEQEYFIRNYFNESGAMSLALINNNTNINVIDSVNAIKIIEQSINLEIDPSKTILKA